MSLRSPRGQSPLRSPEQDRARSRSLNRSKPRSDSPSRSLTRSPSQGRRDRYRSKTRSRSPSRGRTRSRSRSRGGHRYNSRSESRSLTPNPSPPRSSKVSASLILPCYSHPPSGSHHIYELRADFHFFSTDRGRKIDQKCHRKSHPRDLRGIWRDRVSRSSNQQSL